MIKRLLTLALAAVFLAGLALAQTPAVKPVAKDTLKTSSPKKAEPAKAATPAVKPVSQAPSAEGGHFMLGMQAGGCKLVGGSVDQSTIGVTGSVMVGYAFNASLSARLMAGIGLMGAKAQEWEPNASNYKTTVIPVSVDVLYRLVKSPGVAPYLLAGLGYLPCTNELSADAESLATKLDANKLMFGGGLGVQFPINQALSFFVEGRYDYFGEKVNNSGSVDTNSAFVRASAGIATNLFSLGEGKPAVASVTGRITDSAKKGLAAKVTAGGKTVRTNPATGEYRIDEIPFTNLPLKVSAEAEDHIAKTEELLLTKQNKKIPAVKDLQLARIPVKPAAVSGNVIDYKTGNPLPAKVLIAGTKTVSLAANAGGQFSTMLDPGEYKVNISAEGYNDKTVSITAKDNTPMALNYALVKKKEVFAFENINFAVGKADILPASEPMLVKLLKVLQDNQEIKVEIAGHTDNIGRVAKNQTLSQARAESVVKWLAGRGIAADKMAARGYGSSQPVASNKTKAGRAQNRRIEIVVLEK